MYDLDILTSAGTGAVEVTTAADPGALELWKIVNSAGVRWIEPTLTGGWIIELRLASSTRASRLRKNLPRLLVQLELAGVRSFGNAWGETIGPVEAELRQLGALSGGQQPTEFPGSIYCTGEFEAQFVADGADEVSSWLSAFLEAPQQADIRDKLRKSSAPEKHAFVIVPSLGTAELAVLHALWQEDGSIPAHRPSLPEPLTHVWVAPSELFGEGSGLRWSSHSGWRRFPLKAAGGQSLSPSAAQ